MQVRRRAFPLDFKVAQAVKAGKMQDPRIKSTPTGPGSHTPKMKGVRLPIEKKEGYEGPLRPVLYTSDGLEHSLVVAERTEAAIARGTVGIVTLLLGKTRQKVEIPYEKYGRTAKTIRVEGWAAPWGEDVLPGKTYVIAKRSAA